VRKKNLSRISFLPDLGKKIQRKISNRDEIG